MRPGGYRCGCLDLPPEKRPDLLLLDQSMPGESRVTLLRRLRQPAGDLCRAQVFMSKPFDHLGLVARVQRILKLRGDWPRHVDLRSAVLPNPLRAQVPEMTYRRAL